MLSSGLLTITLFVSTLIPSGRSDDFSSELLWKVDNYLYQSIMCQKIPGLSISIVKLDGTTKSGVRTYSGGYGSTKSHQIINRPPYVSNKVRNSDTEGSKVTGKTPFCIGDLTKAFTVTLVGQMKELGLLRWDQPINSFLNDSEKQIESGCSTLQDILSQSTPILSYPGMEEAGFPVDSREKLVRSLSRFESHFAKKSSRDAFNYNNALYTLAGYIAAKLKNTSWEGMVQKSVIKPLDMSDTIPIAVVENFQERFPQTLVFQDDVPHWVPPDLIQNTLPNGPALSLCSSAQDITKWITFLLSKTKSPGLKRVIIEPETLREIWTPRTELNLSLGNGTKLNGYALGWAVGTYFEELLIYHFGSVFGFKSAISLLPEKGIGVFVSVSGSLHGSVQAPTLISQGILALLMEEDGKTFAGNSFSLCDAFPTKQPAAPKCVCTTPDAYWRYVGIYSHPGLGHIQVRTRFATNPYLLGAYDREYLEINYGRTGVARICASNDNSSDSGQFWLQYHSPLSLFLPTCPPTNSSTSERSDSGFDPFLQLPINLLRFHITPNESEASGLTASFIQKPPSAPVFIRLEKASTTAEPFNSGGSRNRSAASIIALIFMQTYCAMRVYSSRSSP